MQRLRVALLSASANLATVVVLETRPLRSNTTIVGPVMVMPVPTGFLVLITSDPAMTVHPEDQFPETGASVMGAAICPRLSASLRASVKSPIRSNAAARMRCASRMERNDGAAKETTTANTATVTISSMSVKPRVLRRLEIRMVIPPYQQPVWAFPFFTAVFVPVWSTPSVPHLSFVWSPCGVAVAVNDGGVLAGALTLIV